MASLAGKYTWDSAVIGLVESKLQRGVFRSCIYKKLPIYVPIGYSLLVIVTELIQERIVIKYEVPNSTIPQSRLNTDVFGLWLVPSTGIACEHILTIF